MQVNVFIARETGDLTSKLLVLPVSPQAAIPQQFCDDWRFFGTFDSENPLFVGVAIELHLQAKGYAIVDL